MHENITAIFHAGAGRQRWTATENVIREMVSGDNLNVNYGYERQEVPNRTRQHPCPARTGCGHQAEAAQTQLAATEHQLATTRRQLEALAAQHAERQQALTEQLTDLSIAHAKREAEGQTRQQAGQSTRRVEQQLAHLDRETQTLTTRQARRTTRFETQTRELVGHHAQLETKRTERQVALAAIDLTERMPAPSACWARVFERDLEKDQITPALAAQVQVWPISRLLSSTRIAGVATGTLPESGATWNSKPQRHGSTGNVAVWSTPPSRSM